MQTLKYVSDMFCITHMKGISYVSNPILIQSMAGLGYRSKRIDKVSWKQIRRWKRWSVIILRYFTNGYNHSSLLQATNFEAIRLCYSKQNFIFHLLYRWPIILTLLVHVGYMCLPIIALLTFSTAKGARCW